MRVPTSLYPVVVLEDRYSGSYSGGAWLAIARADEMDNGTSRAVRCLEGGPHGGDTDAMMFWHQPPEWIAAGATPDAAVLALIAKVKT